MVKAQQPATTINLGKTLLFINASFERNTKSFIRQNQDDKMQSLTINDLRKEINILKKEVAEINQRLEKIEKE
jgi:ubiquinone biosynthesis protein UbiJ